MYIRGLSEKGLFRQTANLHEVWPQQPVWQGDFIPACHFLKESHLLIRSDRPLRLCRISHLVGEELFGLEKPLEFNLSILG